MGAADLIVQGIPPGWATGRGRSKMGPGNVLGGLPDPPGLVEQFAFGGHEFPFRYVAWGAGAGGGWRRFYFCAPSSGRFTSSHC